MLVKRVKTQHCFLLVLICMLFVSNRISAVEPTLKWMKSSGGVSDDYVQTVLCDNKGNSFIVGYFKSTQFKIGTINLNHSYSGEPRMYIAKYDSLGNVLWAVTSARDELIYVHSAALDTAGNIVVGGHFSSSSATFGANVLYNSNAYVYGKMYLAKYDKNGNALWAKTSPNCYLSCAINAVTIDNKDNIFVTGQFQDGAITFANKSLQNSTSGNQDVFLFKLNSNGDGVWANSLGGSNHDVGLTLAVNSNAIYVGGTFKSPTLIVGNNLISNYNTNGSKDLFITKYDTNGTFKWMKKIGGADEDESINFSADTVGNLYVGGSFKSLTANFDALSLTKPSVLNTCMYFTKLDNNGVFKWVKSTTDNLKNSAIYGVKSDVKGNVYTTGFFQSDVLNVDNFTMTNSFADYNEMFMSKFDSAGIVLNAGSIIGFGNDYGRSVAVDNKGNVFYAGVFAGNNLIASNAFVTNINNGTTDVVVMKFNEANFSQITTSLDQSNLISNQKSVYPNPFVDNIYIDVENSEISNVEVFNAVGVKVDVSMENETQKIMLNTSNFPKGLYVVRITPINGKILSKLLIK